MPDQEPEQRSFGELLASCAAADAVSRPPEPPSLPARGEGSADPSEEEPDAA
ncbi:hypothetical protein [Streptomyces gobiensis]|uniref:hypothetical protein n=1 Tax=Streptomyces gobiensis TaxID=2875706 RepID=UPI001E50742C|nr:hypothetical protein [Streptomyces gobiensis]UGY93153.1 hypothetical protein test1122_16490 [Streptomyces gobiensis]